MFKLWACFALSSFALASDQRTNDVVGCVANDPNSVLYACIKSEIDLCLSDDVPASHDPECIVGAISRLAERTDQIVASFIARRRAENAGTTDISPLAEITVRRAREVYALECRFHEEWMAVSMGESRQLDPLKNEMLAICLFSAEASALARLRVFLGDENADLF